MEPDPASDSKTDAASILGMMYETCGDDPECRGSIAIITDSIGWAKERMIEGLRVLMSGGLITISNGMFQLTPAGIVQGKAFL
jgi:hypothetical protein